MSSSLFSLKPIKYYGSIKYPNFYKIEKKSSIERENKQKIGIELFPFLQFHINLCKPKSKKYPSNHGRIKE